MKTLALEVNRLRARLAAEAGDEDLLKFILQSSTEEQSYIEDLKSRLVCVNALLNVRPVC